MIQIAEGADYAEYFENLNPGEIEKGAIVALENGKARTAVAGDSFIIGVVSTNPAFVGNYGDVKNRDEIANEKENRKTEWTLVSLVGQVPVNVKGAISHGDYIELDNNGVGKKAIEWHPNIIGRAMESYNSGAVGKITVLVK